MMLDFAAKMLSSYHYERSPEKIRCNFADLLQGLMSFPLNIPGTGFHKCLQVNEKRSILCHYKGCVWFSKSIKKRKENVTVKLFFHV